MGLPALKGCAEALLRIAVALTKGKHFGELRGI